MSDIPAEAGSHQVAGTALENVGQVKEALLNGHQPRIEPVPPVGVEKARLTVLRQVYYQPPGEEPTSVECASQYHVAGKEDPYKRRMVLTEADGWQRLDLGWCKGPLALLVLKNECPRFDLNLPADSVADEIERLREGCIEVCVRTYSGVLKADMVIPAGDMLEVRPAEVHSWQVRCVSGSSRLTLLAVLR